MEGTGLCHGGNVTEDSGVILKVFPGAKRRMEQPLKNFRLGEMGSDLEFRKNTCSGCS